MRCIMCETLYSEEHGDVLEGFCCAECRNVYERIFSADERSAPGIEC